MDKINDNQEYNKQRDKDRRKFYKQYYKDNIEYYKQYYQKNKENKSVRFKEYYNKNKGKWAEYKKRNKKISQGLELESTEKIIDNYKKNKYKIKVLYTDGAKMLADAIIERAVKDWKREEYRQGIINFIKSDWFDQLAYIDSSVVLKMLSTVYN